MPQSGGAYCAATGNPRIDLRGRNATLEMGVTHAFPSGSHLFQFRRRCAWFGCVFGVVRPQVVGFVDVGLGEQGPAVFTGLEYPF